MQNGAAPTCRTCGDTGVRSGTDRHPYWICPACRVAILRTATPADNQVEGTDPSV